jgi:hypothetical protein
VWRVAAKFSLSQNGKLCNFHLGPKKRNLAKLKKCSGVNLKAYGGIFNIPKILLRVPWALTFGPPGLLPNQPPEKFRK